MYFKAHNIVSSCHRGGVEGEDSSSKEDSKSVAFGGKVLSLLDLPPTKAMFDSDIYGRKPPQTTATAPGAAESGENLDDITNFDELVPEEPDVTDIILGQYLSVTRPSKVARGPKRWSVELSAGIMQIGGVEIPFGKMQGNFSWQVQQY